MKNSIYREKMEGLEIGGLRDGPLNNFIFRLHS